MEQTNKAVQTVQMAKSVNDAIRVLDDRELNQVSGGRSATIGRYATPEQKAKVSAGRC